MFVYPTVVIFSASPNFNISPKIRGVDDQKLLSTSPHQVIPHFQFTDIRMRTKTLSEVFKSKFNTQINLNIRQNVIHLKFINT